MAANHTLEQVQAENSELKLLQQRSFETTVVDNPSKLQDILNLAKVMAASGIFPEIKNAQRAAGIMILGKQFGLTCAQSLSGGLHIVQGKPMLHYSVILAKVREHPDYDYEILEQTKTICRIQFYRRGKPCGISSFDEKEAKERKTQNMDKMPKVMLLARATGDGVRAYCPDVLGGAVYAHGEMPEPSDTISALPSPSSSRADSIKERLAARPAPAEEPLEGSFTDLSDSIDRVPNEAEAGAIDAYANSFGWSDEAQGKFRDECRTRGLDWVQTILSWAEDEPQHGDQHGPNYLLQSVRDYQEPLL